jgi:hypothetical protein
MNEEQTPLFNGSIEADRRELGGKLIITDEDKERFFKAILADKCYEETVSLFDGQVNIKFKAMTVRENSDVVAQVEQDKKNGVASENDAYYITISCYRLGISLVSVDEKPYSSITRENFSPSTEDDTYILARSKMLLGWSTSKLSAYLDAFQTFERKLVKLTSEVQTPNFWKAST